jgi:hypothetical protein
MAEGEANVRARGASSAGLRPDTVKAPAGPEPSFNTTGQRGNGALHWGVWTCLSALRAFVIRLQSNACGPCGGAKR